MEIQSIIKGRRQRILKILGADWVGGQPIVIGSIRMNVTDLMIRVRASQSLVSQELGKLREAGLVSASARIDKKVFYTLSEDFIERVKAVGQPEIAIKKYRALKKGKNRSVIVEFLKNNPDTQVRNICPEITNRSVISQELNILRDADVVEFREEGKKRFYSLKNN